MAAQVYQSLANATYTAATTALLRYEHHDAAAKAALSRSKIVMPIMPAFNDSETAQGFYGSLTGLLPDGKPTVPLHVDTRMLVTYGLGVMPCMPAQTLCNRTRGSVAASMNNVSFVFPKTDSLLHAHYYDIPGVFTTDFPAYPPVQFDYTGNVSRSLWQPIPATKLYKLRFGSVVQIVAGYQRNLGVHVPLGVALAAAGLGVAVRAWLPVRSRPDPPATGAP
jgi:laccase